MGKTINILRIHRKLQGLSIEALAEIAGINPSLISQVENGQRRPYPKMRKALAEALKVPERTLFFEQERRLNVLRVIRISLGMSQRDLARKVGVSHHTISRIETGAIPCSHRLKAKIAQALGGISPLQLFAESEADDED